MSSEPVDVKLATYMERLDRYIETQSALNVKLADGLEKINTNVVPFNEQNNIIDVDHFSVI